MKSAKRLSVDLSDLELRGGFSDNIYECKNKRENMIIKFYLNSMYDKDSLTKLRCDDENQDG